MNAPQRVARLFAVLTSVAALGLLSLPFTGCSHCLEADGKRHWKLALYLLCVEKPSKPLPPPSAPPPQKVKPLSSVGPCLNDPDCVPWRLRTDAGDFDRGLIIADRPLVLLRSVPAGAIQGYDGRVYERRSCLVHAGGPVCWCDVWEPVPPDGREYTRDLFSQIYHNRVGNFYHFYP